MYIQETEKLHLHAFNTHNNIKYVHAGNGKNTVVLHTLSRSIIITKSHVNVHPGNGKNTLLTYF